MDQVLIFLFDSVKYIVGKGDMFLGLAVFKENIDELH